MDDVAFGRRVEAALERAGLDSSDLGGRTALVSQVAGDFAQTHGRHPAWAWWVPGRIEVFGKHTDYAGGRSLVAAVPRGFAVAAAARDDGTVTVRDARWQVSADIRIGDDRRAFKGWSNYAAVIVRRLARDFPGARLGSDVVFASDLPRAAGVSSSSALVVGVSTALIRRADLESRPEWSRSIASRLDLAGYLGAVENGLAFGEFPGSHGVGTHGGSEDHTAILNCRPGLVSAFRYVPVRAVGESEVPAAWRFVVMASGVEASKAGAAREVYNALSLATRRVVDAWRRRTGNGPTTLGAIVSSGPDAERELQAALQAEHLTDAERETLARRVSHFVAEDARAPLALRAFAGADADALGRLAAASQADAESGLRNQVAETSALASLATSCGAFAATSFGAGFGGSVWALAPADDAAAFAERWRERYAERFPAHSRAAGFVARPAPGVTEIPL
jgi:galactokinase